LTLNRANKRNAMHRDLWEAMGNAARGVAGESPRAVVVTGDGGHFSAGMDLSMGNPLLGTLALAMQTRDEHSVGETIDWLNAQVGAFTELPCPVIAAIEGVCVGSGLELALACDLRVGAHGSVYALPETKVGLCPDVGGARRLHALIGPARTLDLITTSRTIDQATAHTWGILDRICDAGDALKSALALAEQTRVSGPGALAATLTYVRGLGHANSTRTRAAERAAGIAAVMTGEALEGAAAFAQRRAPSWLTD
jgi:enoyl-CoA hydratase/carnithine racemase